jgi:glycosyltransferase involved in cell wall biosynthesis
VQPEAPHARLIYLATEDWYFRAHWLPIAKAASDAGYRVSVACRVQAHAEAISAAGLEVIPLDLRRGSTHPWHELRAIAAITELYRRRSPDLVHHVALKPVLYGSHAAARARVPAVVNALPGLGWVFSSDDLGARALRPFVAGACRWLLGREGSVLMGQNPDDMRLVAGMARVPASRTAVVRGVGVDMARFRALPVPQGLPLVVLPARLLRDKGVEEFVAAASALRGKARFALVGNADPENPAAIPESKVRAWVEQGDVEAWGWRDDMLDVFAQASIVCLPSWREGLPTVLVEAAACARPIVTCDVPGCREVVRDGDNGFLVPPRDPAALAAALERLIGDAQLRRRMGERGRERAVAEFSLEHVVGQTLAIYERLLREAGR